MKLDSMGNWRRTHYTKQITQDLHGQEATLFGWVRDIRDLGGIAFIVLQDKEGTIQITVPKKQVGEEVAQKVEQLRRQYCIGVKGKIKKSDEAPRGVEIIPTEIKILNKAKHPLPLDVTGRTPAELDVRLSARVLDLRRIENQALFRIQHVVVEAIRDYLSSQGFLEVFTPKIITAAAEGGATLFPVDYFGRRAFLAQSPQLYKEQLTLSFEKVYEIATYFRAEPSHTRRHLSEFVSVDVEAAFSTAEDVMQVLEGLIVHVYKAVNEKCTEELGVLRRKIEVPEAPFPRLTYDEVLEELSGQGVEIKWGEDIPTPALRQLEKLHPGFYFITDWPTASKPFYIKPRDDRPEVCEAFDLMHGWVELASGGTRIHDKELLIKRLREQGLSIESFEPHLRSFDYGMPPHAGWGLGLSRLIMVITGIQNIREVVLFPRDRFRLTP